MPNQIVWFDMPVVDLDRAIRFYSAVLGAPVQKHTMGENLALGVLPHEGNDVGGCLVKHAQQPVGDAGPLLYFNCAGRLDAAIGEVEKHGGKILEPKHSIGQHGFRCLALDSEGNRIALHSI